MHPFHLTEAQLAAHKKLSAKARVVTGHADALKNNYRESPVVAAQNVPREVVILMTGLRTVSLANQREHWGVTAKRAKEHRLEAYLMTPALAKLALPAVITLTRIGPRRMDDDNLRGALKNVRDGIADRIGIDDGDARIRWQYDQKRSGKNEYAVRIVARPT